MNLSALHEAVWEMVREGHPVEDSESDSVLLSEAEQMAIRTWYRRLRSVGGKVAELIPPYHPLVWLSEVQPALAISLVHNES